MTSDAAPSPVTSRQVAKGLGTTVLARLGAVVEIVSQPLYVLMFGLTSFGLYAVLWAAINFLANIFDLGMSNALQRTVPQSANRDEAAKALRMALICGVGPCLLVAAAIFFAAPLLAPILNVAAEDQAALIPSIRIFIWALPLTSFLEITTSAMRAKLVFGAEIRLRVVWEQLLRLGFAGVFFFVGMGIKGLMIAHLLSLTVTVLMSIRLVARHYDLKAMFHLPWGGTIERETFLSGLSVLPASMLARVFGDAPTMILNIWLPGAAGAAAAGLFTIARKLSSVVQLVRIAFTYVMAPLASSAVRQDRAQVQDIYAYATRFIVAVALPLALVLAAGSAPLLSLFGNEASGAQAALTMLLVARALEGIFGIAFPVMQVVGAFRHQITASLLGLVVSVGTGLLAIGHLDPLTAITLAMVTGMVVAAAVPMVQLAVFEQLHPFDSQFPTVLMRSFLISGAACLLAVGISYLPHFASVPLTAITALTAIWASMRFALPLVDRQSLGKTGRKLRLFAADSK
jgi:O-antigen/teichoic acid export membrane protein